jgi:hypothetical protein
MQNSSGSDGDDEDLGDGTFTLVNVSGHEFETQDAGHAAAAAAADHAAWRAPVDEVASASASARYYLPSNAMAKSGVRCYNCDERGHLSRVRACMHAAV